MEPATRAADKPAHRLHDIPPVSELGPRTRASAASDSANPDPQSISSVAVTVPPSISHAKHAGGQGMSEASAIKIDSDPIPGPKLSWRTDTPTFSPHVPKACIRTLLKDPFPNYQIQIVTYQVF